YQMEDYLLERRERGDGSVRYANPCIHHKQEEENIVASDFTIINAAACEWAMVIAHCNANPAIPTMGYALIVRKFCCLAYLADMDLVTFGFVNGRELRDCGRG